MTSIGEIRLTDSRALKIVGLEAIPLQIPFGQPFKIAKGAAREVLDVVLVRIHTDQGIVGIGETQAWRRQGGAEILANLVCTIKDHFEPLLIGRSAFDISGILHTLDDAYSNTFYAQAAISDALYDIVGKAVGLPVHRLLGGECRGAVRVGVVLSLKETEQALLDTAQEYFDRGFRYFGLKVGIDPKQDVSNVAALRSHFNDGIAIRVDANGALSRDAAVQLLRKLEPYEIDAAEQPVAAWDLEGLAAVAQATTIPVMVDESLSSDHSLLEIIRRRAASAIHTKLGKNGGMHRTWRLWTLADTAGMRICPGNHPCTGVATAAVAHLCAAWPEPLIDGVFAIGVTGALESDILVDELVPQGGELRVPTAPGLGVEVDMKKIDRYRIDRG